VKKILLVTVPILLNWISPARAVDCPTPGEPCKVVILSPQEEKALTGQNGLLDTAAQGRSLELGGIAVYFKQKILTAPAGEVKAGEKPADPPAVPRIGPTNATPN
jgi:hypothetical protein